MTTSLWCLVIGAVLPYIWLPFTAPARFDKGFDNKLPRVQQAELRGRAARALGAHNNAFEAYLMFAAAVLLAHVLGASPETAGMLSVAWVIARVLHGGMYLVNIDFARTGAFFAGLVANLGLFYIAVQA